MMIELNYQQTTRNIANIMTILKAERIEIEIQEQSMSDAGSKYMVLIKTENNNELKIITTNTKPNLKYTEDNGNIILNKTNL